MVFIKIKMIIFTMQSEWFRAGVNYKRMVY